MRAGIDDRDRPARAVAQKLDQVALRFVPQRRQCNHFRKQPGEAPVVGIEIETPPCNGVLFEPSGESAERRALAHVAAGLHGDNETMMEGGFHG